MVKNIGLQTPSTKEVASNPELFSIFVSVKPLQAGVIPMAHGYHVYALFLNIIRRSDPALAEILHAGEQVKPFTVSTLNGRIPRNRAQLTISPDTNLWLRLTFMDSRVFSHFVDGAMRWGDKPVEIAGVPFLVEEVVTAPRDDIPVLFESFQGILDAADNSPQIALEFITPTVFRSGGKRNNIFPEPTMVFGSYWNKWQALSPVKLEDDLNSYFDKINITRYRLESKIWDFGSYQEVGFAGVSRFEIDKNVPEEKIVFINALADFAQFCGTGAKTTMGMGQTRRQ
jgi:CRISPR-associated endoribonuclease Cas6